MKKALVLAIAMLAVSSVSHAAMDMSKLSVGGGVGYSIPTGDFNDSYKGSFAMAVNGEYAIQNMFAAGMEIGYNFKYPMKDAAKTGGITDGSVKTWQFTPYGKVQHHFDMNGKQATVYGLLGLGLYNFKSSVEAAGTTTDSQTKFGWNIGAGLMLDVAPQWAVGVDVRYHHINTDGSATKSICPSLRTNYRFK